MRVTTEDDDLYYEVRGNGPALVMIAGGGGDGGAYSAVAQRLSRTFKVITYDRRANGRSSMNHPDRFDIHQESRDALAVLRAAGETSAHFVGNSSGAVIALDLVSIEPGCVKSIVAHEPPLARLHPDSSYWQKFFADVLKVRHRFGVSIAMLKFAFGIGVDLNLLRVAALIRESRRLQIQSKVPRLDRKKVTNHFVDWEMIAITDYSPDFEALSKSREKIILAAGQVSLSRKRFYAETVPNLVEKIGCRFAVFPGDHVSFVDRPDEWAAAVREAVGQA